MIEQPMWCGTHCLTFKASDYSRFDLLVGLPTLIIDHYANQEFGNPNPPIWEGLNRQKYNQLSLPLK